MIHVSGRTRLWGFIVFSVIAMLSCKLQVTKTDNSQALSANDATAASQNWFRSGMLPLASEQSVALTQGHTQSLIQAYSGAVAAFKEVYGADTHPYWMASVRSNRFISRDTWDKEKADTNYNPITETDKYNFAHEKGVCRENNRDENNVWVAYERAGMYARSVLDASMAQKPIPWFSGYKTLPHVANYLQASGQSSKNSSRNFDIDVVLGLHAANGEGATQDTSTCGRLAQFKVCDGAGYSFFFDPSFRPHPCQSVDASRAWYPSATDWQAIFSDEMRQTGATVVPIATSNLVGLLISKEFGTSCGDPSVSAKVKTAVADRAHDWPLLKRAMPEYISAYLDRGHRAALLAEVAQKSADKQLAAYSMYASVQQVYKDIVNYRLKPGITGSEPECKPCELVKADGGYLWDPIRRAALKLDYCPSQCWKQGNHPNPADGSWSGKDMGRAFFEPDTSDPTYPSITALLNKHFSELAQKAKLSVDPVTLATQIQQWYVAMHPFIDGDGRTSRYYMEMILNSVGLPFPVLADFWQDTTRSTQDYESIVRQGLSRHIGVVKACTAYAKCMKEKVSGFTPARLCSAQPQQDCSQLLRFSYGGGATQVANDTTLQPCDCSINWETDAKKAKYAKCP